MPPSSAKVTVAGTAAITLLLGLGTGTLIGSQLGVEAPGAVELHVPGAMNLSVFCGSTTVHGEGTEVAFVARDQQCDIEASLSPVMPIRGQVVVGEPGHYVCLRDGTELHCSGPEQGSGSGG